MHAYAVALGQKSCARKCTVKQSNYSAKEAVLQSSVMWQHVDLTSLQAPD